LKPTFRVAILLAIACVSLAAFSPLAQAQKVDVAFGVSTMEAPSANANGPSLTGGAYTGFSGDVLFWHNVGVGGEIFWKTSQSNYNSVFGNIPYRPLFLDVNAVYAPKLASHVYLELSAGIGAMDTRQYCSGCGNGYNTNYTSDKHFMGDFGAGLKIYPTHNFFIRPEAKVYLVNNNQLFSSSYSTRVGMSIGYTFR
jgi:Outer membrane protein beta-barrel domain